MCDFASFLIDRDGDRIYVGNWISHEYAAKVHSLRPDTYVEGEWVSDEERGLSFRTLASRDGKRDNNWYRACVLARYPTRAALLDAMTTAPEAYGARALHDLLLLPAQLDACIAKTTSAWHGNIGRYRADLTPAQLDACIAGTTPEWRGEIGRYRANLTSAQLDACIAGTTPDWRGSIGRYREGLTSAQLDACKC